MQLKDPSIRICKGQMTPSHNDNKLENKTWPSLVGKTIKALHCLLFPAGAAGGKGGREVLPHYVSGSVESECGMWILGSVENKECGICGVKELKTS